MLDNMTTGEKALIGATAIGIAALVFHKPTRNAVGLSDGKRKKVSIISPISYEYEFKNGKGYGTYSVSFDDGEIFSRTYGKSKGMREKFIKSVKARLNTLNK